MSRKKNSSISSPMSTGGGGTFFEQHVGTYLLTLLLVRGIPPILVDCYVTEVSLQNERLGFHTDDFLVVGVSTDGTERKLLGQVKMSLTISSSDADCKNAITDCWLDFNGTSFSALTDRFALVTLRGSTVLLANFAELLECARTANDANEFQTRLSTKGLLNQKCIDYYKEIKTIVSQSEEREIDDSELFPFLQVLYLLSLDLGTATRQHESMAKNLLAHTCVVEDRIVTADATWKALLDDVGNGMGKARQFKYESLPKELRKRHSPIQHRDHAALEQLKRHSVSILNGINNCVGRKQKVHIDRSAVQQELLERLRVNQVVLVSGCAGSGKSGIAKDVVSCLAKDYFSFCFRADEFARSHFDETLKHSNVTVDSETLGTILCAQDRKILLVESIERILEKSVREAFSELLIRVRNDPTWQLILTCRDYSTAQVRAFLLDAYGLEHAVVEVPGLSDKELDDVATKCPSLVRPLANQQLRNLLRVPYFLDKALDMPWAEGMPLPESERAFRNKFWFDVIQGSSNEGGIQIERGRVFVEICLMRARALTMYADAGSLDARVLQSLRGDSLIISTSEISLDLVAPAHDVLEDWAVIHWIETNFAKCDGSLQKLSQLIGTHPAVRRSYRKWISELLERDAASADDIFQGLITEKNLSPQFSDDSLVCFLRSNCAPSFLRRHEKSLFENDKNLLRRVMHLLRVACVAPPGWLGPWRDKLPTFNAPDSDAWAAVLSIVKENLGKFKQDSAPLLLGFIEDWARGVSHSTPYPEGAESVAAIAYHLLEQMDDFGWSEQRKRALKVIAKIPKVDAERFEKMLRRTSTDWGRDLISSDLKEIILEEMDGMPACRDLPELIMSVFLEILFKEEERDPNDRYIEPFDSEFSMDNGRLFGLKRVSELDYFPASAFQGPYIHLLRNHFQEGVQFIISIFNKCGEAFKNAYASRTKAVHTAELCFADGYKRTQIGDEIFWNLFRGRSVAPPVLQSALMALELVLLEYAELGVEGLDRFLISIMRRSETVALTSVVASIAIAHPRQTHDTLLVVLSSPECIILDRRRMSRDLSPSLSGLFPNLDSSDKIYFDERRASDAREHRKFDLEHAIRTIQLGPKVDSVQSMIDRHLTMLPPLAEQREFDRSWRLALHRMDLRQYTAQQVETNSSSDDQGEGQHQILFTPKQPAHDLQQIVEKTAAEHAEFMDILHFKMWSVKVFIGEDSATFPPDQWRERLEQAKTISLRSPVDPFHAARTGATTVAAVCARYHWDELKKIDQDWCIQTLCIEIERTSNDWDHMERVQRQGAEGGRAAAWVLPILVGKTISKIQRQRVLKCIALAVTHSIEEIRWFVVYGVGVHLWQTDQSLLLRCVNAIATEAKMIEKRIEAESGKPYSKRSLPDAIQKSVAKIVRKGFYDDSVVSQNAYAEIDVTGGYGAHANCRIMSIMKEAPTEPIAIECFQQATRVMADWWHADRKGRRSDYYEFKNKLTEALEELLFTTSEADAKSILEPIIDAIENCPDKVYWLVQGLINSEARRPRTDRFWFLWQLFADRMLSASWMDNIGGQYPMGTDLVYAVFLAIGWKDNVRHWKSLEGYTDKIDDLFVKLPPSSLVLHAYCNFLYHIGEQSMPQAFVLIANKLNAGDAKKMLTGKGDIIFMLEILLQRHVYGKPIDLKKSEKRREAVLYLLEQLIENGSSAAYRMRDDFVTPMSLTPLGA